MVVQQGTSLFIKPFKVPGGKKKHKQTFFKECICNFIVVLCSLCENKLSLQCECGLLCCVLLNLYTLCVEGNAFFIYVWWKTRVMTSAGLLLHVRLARLKSAQRTPKEVGLTPPDSSILNGFTTGDAIGACATFSVYFASETGFSTTPRKAV